MTATISMVSLVASSLLILVGVPMTMFYIVKLLRHIKMSSCNNGRGNGVPITLLQAVVNPRVLSGAAANAHSALAYWAKRLFLGLILAIPAIAWYPVN